MAREALEVARNGHTVIKVKVISATVEDPLRTIDRVRLVREAVGPGALDH